MWGTKVLQTHIYDTACTYRYIAKGINCTAKVVRYAQHLKPLQQMAPEKLFQQSDNVFDTLTGPRTKSNMLRPRFTCILQPTPNVFLSTHSKILDVCIHTVSSEWPVLNEGQKD